MFTRFLDNLPSTHFLMLRSALSLYGYAYWSLALQIFLMCISRICNYIIFLKKYFHFRNGVLPQKIANTRLVNLILKYLYKAGVNYMVSSICLNIKFWTMLSRIMIIKLQNIWRAQDNLAFHWSMKVCFHLYQLHACFSQ